MKRMLIYPTKGKGLLVKPTSMLKFTVRRLRRNHTHGQISEMIEDALCGDGCSEHARTIFRKLATDWKTIDPTDLEKYPLSLKMREARAIYKRKQILQV